MALLDHALRGLLRDKEAAERGYLHGLLDRRRIEFDDRPARPPAGVVDDEVETVAAGIDRGEQPLDIVGPAGVAGDRRGAGLLHQAGELLRVARRQHHVHAVAGTAARQRRA